MASSRGTNQRSLCAAVCLAVLVAGSLRPSAARLLHPEGNDDCHEDVVVVAGAAVDVAAMAEKEAAVVDKYAPLLLTMLPRAPVPPSGPSGGTNDSRN
ncbi:hypothetical protein ACP4OV_016240 [Aristida adscensionis]